VKLHNEYGWLEVERNAEIKKARASSAASVELSEDQRVAYEKLSSWLAGARNSASLLTLGGYAGTGKTTLVALFAREQQLSVAFCAYTGKASNVLQQKLHAAGVAPEFCGTIHRLIYRPTTDDSGKVVSWSRIEVLPYDLIVVDEASMVDETIFADLQSYGIPILAVGDHGQLPPVKGSFSLMQNPDVRLERIHRQAADNPIIQLSVAIRERGLAAIPASAVYSKQQVDDLFLNLFGQDATVLSTVMLSFTNRRRVSTNAAMRRMLFGEAAKETVCQNDLVVCLKNSRFSYEYVFNGMRGVVEKVRAPKRKVVSVFENGTEMFDYANEPVKLTNAQVAFPDDRLTLQANLNTSQFGRDKTIGSFADAGLPDKSRWTDVGLLFDYGYCLTAHKAQGSEFADVAVILEYMGYVDEDYRRRWLYTAVSRASQRLYLIA
jgi:exodeoxyribonuclease-5